MEIYKGTATFSGIAIGKILYYSRGEYQIRQCLVSNIKKEISNFQEARLQAVQKLHELYEANRLLNEQEAGVFLRQIKLLESESYQNAIESSIANEKVNAAYAVMINRDELVETFRHLEEPVIRRRINDMQEISNRLIQILGGAAIRINLGDEPVILVAEALSPTEIMEMDKDKLLAVVMHHGSAVSHASIMAKTMEIPTLVDVAADDEWDGKTAIVDGYTGTFYLNPDAEIQKEYEIRLEADRREREELLKLKAQKDETKDGSNIGLYANIGNMSDLSSVLFYGAKGIGLLRSEFQYLGRENYPRENELFRAYKKVAETMGERLAVIRTAKCGGVYHAALRLVDGKDLKLARHIAYLLPDVAARLAYITHSQLAGQLFRAGQRLRLVLDCFAFTALSLPGFKVGFVKYLKAAQFFVCQNDPPLVRVTVVGCIRQGWPTSAGCIYHLPASASDRMRFPLMGALLSAYAYSSHGSIRAGRTP